MAETLTHSMAISDIHAPVIRKIAAADVWQALRAGWSDFLTIPTQLIFLCILYPIMGLLAAHAATDESVLPLLFPLLAGLTLLGPVLAVGIYELSRRREAGLPVSWLNAFDVLRSPSILGIVAIGLMLLAIFIAWIVAAKLILLATVGADAAGSAEAFRHMVFETSEGAELIVIGNLVGFLFAVSVLALTAVSVPMLLDREVSPVLAVQTSLRVIRANPIAMALWGLIVAVSLLIASIPLFIGLAVAMPVLGHATWHLYRRVVG